MVYRIIFTLYLITAISVSFAQKKSEPVPVIFDSDMGPDYDDVGAITLLHAFADSGYAKILATVASTKYEGVAAVFNVFNSYFNRPGLPIGVPKGKASEIRDGQHWSDSLLANFPHKIKANEEVPDAVEVYRKILSAQPDKTVTIVTVGFLTNLANLLQSPPDKYSGMNGAELIKKKVKQLVCMAGRFPSGSEFNVKIDPPASQIVFGKWPTPVLFSGFEIGYEIRTGLPLIHNDAISHSPVKDVFRISIPLSPQDSAGRMSWDETAVLIAVKGYSDWYNDVRGKMIVAENGSNNWSTEPKLHRYITEREPHVIVQQLINKLIMHQPVKK